MDMLVMLQQRGPEAKVPDDVRRNPLGRVQSAVCFRLQCHTSGGRISSMVERVKDKTGQSYENLTGAIFQSILA